MRIIRSIALGLALNAGAVALFAQGSEQLSNGGFEPPFNSISPNPACVTLGGDVASWWFDNSCWPGNETTSVTYAAEPGSPFGGTSQRIDVGPGGLVQLAQALDLNRDTRYTISSRLRSSSNQRVRLSLRQQGPPYAQYVVADVQLTSEWTDLRADGFTSTTGGFLMLRTSDPGTLWIDAASVLAEPMTLPLNRTAKAPTPNSHFGMHIHRAGIAWPQLGSRPSAVRIWDADGVDASDPCAQWACINYAPGLYDWSALDLHVQRALTTGADVLFVLGRPPAWAAANPLAPSPYGPGQSSPPRTKRIWSNWVRAVGSRYQGQIRHWETWNEPNDEQFYSGTPEELVELAAIAHDVLKSIDPANVMVGPSPYEIAYLDRYLELGGGEYADVLGYHFYLFDVEPEFLYESYIPNVLLAMQRHGCADKPLWNTEAGWWSPPALPTDLGVGYLARAYLMNRAAGVERHYFYSWDGFPTAGVAPASGPGFATPTAAGIAYREVAEWMAGSRLSNARADANGVWSVELLRTNGTRAYAAWNPDGATNFALPASWSVNRVLDLAGGLSLLGGAASWTIDERPVLFE